MATGTLLIRVDAGVEMGTGHVMRCLALAEAWQRRGGAAVFLSYCPFEGLRRRVRAAGAELVFLPRPEADSQRLAELLRNTGLARSAAAACDPVWVVLDGYHFDFECQQVVRNLGCRLLAVDDFAHAGRYQAEVVLNQNAAAEEIDYLYYEGTALLLGSSYALLRPEFQAWRDWQRSTPQRADKILVTCGGSDPPNATARVLEALALLADRELQVRVIVGAGNPHRESLQRLARAGAGRIKLLTDVEQMAELMAWADVAVAAAGSTCWELAYMQLPALLLSIAANQDPLAQAMDGARAAESLGRAEEASPQRIARKLAQLCDDQPLRTEFAAAGRGFIDGAGADRVVTIMHALSSILPRAEVRLRRVVRDDLMALWRLSNEPSVRQSSLCTERIFLEEHTQWFEDRLENPKVRMWALEFQSLLLAYVRYTCLDADTAEISLAVSPAFRRRGLALRLLVETRAAAHRELAVRQLQAVIREENTASASAFRKAGYTYVESQVVHGVPCHIFDHTL